MTKTIQRFFIRGIDFYPVLLSSTSFGGFKFKEVRPFNESYSYISEKFARYISQTAQFKQLDLTTLIQNAYSLYLVEMYNLVWLYVCAGQRVIWCVFYMSL